jgi:hypothetical protein
MRRPQGGDRITPTALDVLAALCGLDFNQWVCSVHASITHRHSKRLEAVRGAGARSTDGHDWVLTSRASGLTGR